jgi:hypothetical protein
MRLAPLLALALAVPLSVFASNDDGKRAARLVELFGQYCLDKFPDDVALAEAAEAADLIAMPDRMARAHVSGLPAKGWVVGVPNTPGRYHLVVEAPPYHACAIWAYDGQAEAYDASVDALLTASVGARKLKLMLAQKGRVEGAGMPTMDHRHYGLVVPPATLPTEAIVFMATNDPNANLRARLSRAAGPHQ